MAEDQALEMTKFLVAQGERCHSTSPVSFEWLAWTSDFDIAFGPGRNSRRLHQLRLACHV